MLRNFKRLLRKQEKRPHSPLDDVLFFWPDGSPFRVSDMLRSLEVKGVTGSGKSSGSLMHFLRALAAHTRATMLVIAQKPEERAILEEIFARAGKRDRLIIVDKDAKQRTNFIDVERAAGADARGIVEFLTVLKEGLSAGQAGGRSNEAFWQLSEERLLFNAVEAVRQGTGGIAAPDLLEFIGTAPNSPQTLDAKNHPDLREAWEKKFHFQTMYAAQQRPKTEIEAHDFQVISNYWAQEFPYMDDKPRSGILAGAMNTLHTANTGLARLITSTTTNILPRAFDEGTRPTFRS